MMAASLYSVRLMRWSVRRPCGKFLSPDPFGTVAASYLELAGLCLGAGAFFLLRGQQARLQK